VQTLRLANTPTFRVALLYALIFSAATVGLYAFIYHSTVLSFNREIDSGIDAQVDGLAEVYQRLGLAGLRDVIQERATAAGDRSGIYLLVDAFMEPLAGNLAAWPASVTDRAGQVEFDVDLTERGGVRRHGIRARVFTLPDGGRVLAGRDIQDLKDFERRLFQALGWALAVAIGLGVPGGLAVSRRLLRRVERINQASRAFSAGAMSHRIPIHEPGDELDLLARNLNDMFDRIEHLMLGMRAVTDSIAHDLRGPLTRLRGKVDLALAAAPDLGAYRAALERAVAETEKVVAVFDALICIARTESGLPRDNFEDVDVALIAHEVEELYEPTAEHNGQTLTVGDPVRPARVWGNRQLIAQALANVVDNAAKYAGRGARIRIAVASEPHQVRLSVTDDGPGIPPEDRERVLERFTRLAGSQEVPGSGLGLSLVAAVAKLHNGALLLHDNAPGLGVELLLPVVAAFVSKRAA
jgi:signal transduction histidine kinase